MTRHQRNLSYQAAALLATFGAVALVVSTATVNLEDRGIELETMFLGDRAGFTLSETWLPYSPDDSNYWAIAVGIGNTLVVSFIVALFSTVIGTFLGIFRLSDNMLASGFARSWVEIARNSPPILLLLFLYSFLGQILPNTSSTQIMPGVYLSLRGLALPVLDLQGAGIPIAAAIAVAIAAITITAKAANARQHRTGQRPAWTAAAVVISVVCAVFGAIFISGFAKLNLPRATGPDIIGGYIVTPEFFTLIAGLTLYTSGFVAEIVRTGLQSVTRGQWEAAYALGLSKARTLRLVVMPQMMRVIIPPMTSQYINIVKNSTLVIAIGYADFMVVMGTVINKTSHAIEGTVIIIGVYLAINLSLSAVMNRLNRRFQEVQR